MPGRRRLRPELMAYPAYGSQWPPPGAPLDTGKAEKAYRWYVVYVVAMLVLYLLCVVGSLIALTADFDVTDEERTEIQIYAGVFLAASLAMLPLFGVGLLAGRRSWGWVYGLVLIGLGATSCCTWPITIPLLIQWLKPEMKARFGVR
jgi:hypothetical protein